MGAPVRPGYVAQYNVIPCPACGNVTFSFNRKGHRICAGPQGCGHTWDAGEAGRKVVTWRSA